MTTNSNSAAILKDVVAYVDVWSREKTENYSKSVIQQLCDMGAEVTKRLNKQVTHVVFQYGHPATWDKAQKTGVKLVSVLWVARCKDVGEHVDEEPYPALNDEANPALRRRAHRSRQPKDLPVLTPENNKRMKKELDKQMKELHPVPSPPFFPDVSPYLILENGRHYLPGTDAMAQRLKWMREEHEKFSPPALEMAESRLSPELESSLGNTPSHISQLDTDSEQKAKVGQLDCGDA